jgi:diguanylate cyclase (GGDEF)-like protein
MEHLSRDEYVELRKFNKLISNLAVSMVATIINTIIVTATFWNIASHGKLAAWCSCNVGYALSRYMIIYYYKKSFSRAHLKTWKIGTLVSFAIAGILFGSSGMLFMDPAKLEYAIFLYFVAGGMAVGSVGSYHNDLPIYFVYSSTVFIIPTVNMYLLHMGISSAMIVLGMVFYTLISTMAIRLSHDLSESLQLRYDNNQLVRSLEEEKTNTERLNTELLEKNRELNELSLVDPLTTVRNRRYLFDIVMPEVEAFIGTHTRLMSGRDNRVTDARKGYGILMIDMDHFKQVNDSYGHDAGDMVLVQFTHLLRESLRRDDIVIRFGGEEFIVVLKKVDESSACEIVTKLHECIQSSPFTVGEGKTISLTCSIGFLVYPLQDHNDPHFSFEKMISIVDGAMYHAKTHGRNICVQALSSGKQMTFKTIEPESQLFHTAVSTS